MATNGIYGFRKNDVDKITYNHSDSYPSCLGNTIADLIRNHSNEELNGLCDKINLIDDHIEIKKLKKEVIEKFRPYINRNKEYFSYNKLTQEFNDNMDIYSFLHKFMGDPEQYFKNPEIHIMCDGTHFIKNSLYCEWGYIINLDTNVLEVWKGFQKEIDLKNRYGTSYFQASSGDKYYPCKLIKEIPFEKVREPKFYIGDII